MALICHHYGYSIQQKINHTGLGLSLAYDIVTKGHGGTLEVETKEGEGTEFMINFPVK